MAHRLHQINRRRGQESDGGAFGQPQAVQQQEYQQPRQPIFQQPQPQMQQQPGYIQPGLPQQNQQQQPYQDKTHRAPEQRGGWLPDAQAIDINIFRPILQPSDTFQLFSRRTPTDPVNFPVPQSLWKSNSPCDTSPHFLRPTSNYIFSLPKKSKYPSAVWITPFAASATLPRIDVTTPLRCCRCKAYINPYFQFDGSRQSVVCNICNMKFSIEPNIEEVNINSTVLATEGAYQFVVKDKFYFRNRVDIVKVVIAIEITSLIMEIGVFSHVIESIRSAVQNGQFEANVRIGIVYFTGNTVCVLKAPDGSNEKPTSSSQQPPGEDMEGQVLQYAVSVFPECVYSCPLSEEDFLLNPSTDKAKINRLLDHIVAVSDDLWQTSPTFTTSNYVAVVKVMKDLYELSIGRMILFSVMDPRNGGQHSIRIRTVEESKQPMKPISGDFIAFGRQLAKSKIGVEHFMFTKDTMTSRELVTVHGMSSMTGGALHFYQSYRHQSHSQHLYYQIYSSLTNVYAYDIDLTCRVSTGLNVSSYGVPDGFRECRDIQYGCMGANQSILVNLDVQEKLDQSAGAYLQFALMYTNANVKSSPDYRLAEILRINSLNFYSFAMRYYPKLYSIGTEIYDNTPVPGDFIEQQDNNSHQQGEQSTDIAILPPNLALCTQSITDDGAYLFHSGDFLIILVLSQCDPSMLEQLFGTSSPSQLEQLNSLISNQSSSHSIRIQNIINQLRRRNSENSSIYPPLIIKCAHEKKGPFNELLASIVKEDYPDMNLNNFISYLQREVMNVGK